MIKHRIVNFLLTLFYIFVIICVVGGVKYYFHMQKQMDERLVFEVAKLKMKYGETYRVELNEDVDRSKVVWESSNPDLVSVDDNGNVSVNGNQAVKVTITATTEDGKSSSVEIEVSEVETNVSVTGITSSISEVNLKYGESSKVVVNISPSNATDKRINWTSSNASLVTVDNGGTIKAVGNKNEEAIITATTVDGGYKATVKVKVSYVDQSIKVKSISISNSSVSLKYGETEKLKATISPSNATNKQITWTSSNPSLVSVDAYGTLTTKSNKTGEVTITATTEDGGYKATAKVKVTEKKTVVKATGVKLSKTSVSLKYGETTKISATVSPLTATNKGVSWTSSDTSLVTVDSSGNIKAVGNKNGTATIVVKTADGGHTASATVKVSKIRVSGVKVSSSSITLKYGASKKVSATVSPTNAADKSVTWTSSDTSLVTVDSSGNIKAVGNKNGTATVTVKTKDGGYTATIKVTVQKVTIKVTGVKLNQSKGTVYLNSSNKTVELTATVSPSNAENKSVTWTSSNTNVATVSNGKVTAKAQGQATISATTVDGGFVAKYTITVKKKVIVVVTASQGVRMNDWFKTYTSAKGYKYSVSDKTLKYVYKSGSGFDYQLNEGLTKAKTFISETYSSTKAYTEISLFFTMTGNSVRLSTCTQINNNSTSPTYTEIASGYSNAVKSISDNKYSIKGYVLSHGPLQSKHPEAKDHHIVYSTSGNECKAGKRSGWKYVLSNEKMISVIKDYSNIQFVDNFSNFIVLNNREKKTFTWLRPYNTVDGLHWDEATTIDYMTLAFNTAGM